MDSPQILRSRSKKSGSALMTVFLLLMLMAVAGASYIASSTTTMRLSKRQQYDVQTTHLCEAGIQAELDTLWLDFRNNQNFADLDQWCQGSSLQTPRQPLTGNIPNIGNYSVAVTSYSQPDAFARNITVRAVGWVDMNHSGKLTSTDPQKVVDVTATYSLNRSGVFDYTYFINNYGWMDNFGPNDLFLNGDSRANGDFTFTRGSPTANGSVIAAQNMLLTPGVPGLIKGAPVKMDDSAYTAFTHKNSRVRQAFNASINGDVGSTSYLADTGLFFQSQGTFMDNEHVGALLEDSSGSKAWERTSVADQAQTQVVDGLATSQLIMPDLNNLNLYLTLSSTYVDKKQSYMDGTPNPNYGEGAYIQVWDNKSKSYQTITQGGVLNGSASLIGTAQHPIRIHGPVTITQDAVIKGNVSGQGTIYTGRNVHIVGSIQYTNPPNFIGPSQEAMDESNEKADILALAARGSVIMGDTSKFTPAYPLQYMTPPFTKPRYDDAGNLLPAFDATQVDSTGFKKYQSVLGDKYIHKVSSAISQIDAIMYTNNVGGGNIGTGGKGIAINGSLISKDEAMVAWSAPMSMNYDDRIFERAVSAHPLIDIDLPRSPQLLQTSWHDLGFYMAGVPQH